MVASTGIYVVPVATLPRYARRMATTTTAATPPRPKGLGLIAAALRNRKTTIMLAFGFSSGLPFALLVGTLTAWLGEVGIKLATIGVFSWIGLAYAFKFLWSPLVDRVRLPGLERLGRRRGWIALCQAVIVVSLIGIASIDPARDIGRFVGFAFLGALASATQDIAIDGWRIDVADAAGEGGAPIELLSALHQFGYRTASIVGGAVALLLAGRMSWPAVFGVMAALMALTVVATLAAPDTQRPDASALRGALTEPGALRPDLRAIGLAVVGASWLFAILLIVRFALSVLTPAPGLPPPSVGDFTKAWGPVIIVCTVFVPLAVAALANRLARDPRRTIQTAMPTRPAARAIADHLYSALVDPLAELSARLGWGVLSLIGFILTYAICYNIWASFAYPFYLDHLHYTKDEVAFASKLFGIAMTMIGISLGGYLFAKVGRFPTILLGAVLPALGNFLYADLAEGGRGIDAFARALRLDALAAAFGSDARMVRLLLAISYENVATGLALTAFVAYVSSIVARRFAAIQYALLSSLLSLVGTLGRGAVGEAFDRYGYAPVFRWTAATALVSVTFVALEWARTARADRAVSRAAHD